MNPATIGQDLLYPTIEIALQAGTIVLKHYKNTTFHLKEDASPLTQADLQSHHFITQALKKIAPIPVCSEEDPLAYDERKDLSYLWLLDPLDGTKDFLAQNDGFTINIALLQNNLPILGIVYAPATKALYYAYKNGGAYFSQINSSFDPKNAINLSALPNISRPPIACASNFHNNQATQEFLQRHNLKAIQLGSSLKLCALAHQKADIYPRLNGTKEWDTAASDIILTESGGIILDIETKKPLIYNKSDIKNNHFIAFAKSQINGQIHQKFCSGVL
ncbi:3'(2'),5'-bisphosphate nucleotidase CysQ [Helicobacter sp. 11S02596-1]|uniref:3'(2'),5'-bisphosphate nucleotidase CysQ family protein n=1 Tax=Helicobacter sp. 11S02596-1 TaxID=1476194 RepID=UPI000BA53838|nr:3'(2'),5'-bisphosphate nucleotidase CysQ [Helicobacter sp. 11S02596-1]PAF45189.1 3'(2'),5'-bisphosphate nucleotidase CysQ [Helicobacter sp. 11S02596-1]